MSATLTQLMTADELTNIITLTEHDVLDGGDVVPSFQIKVADIFLSSSIT